MENQKTRPMGLCPAESIENAPVLVTLKRDYGFLKDSQKNTHTIKATNTKSLLSEVYVSIYACSKDLNINAGVIKLCCDKKKKVNIGTSKTDFSTYTFDYTVEPTTKQPVRKITLHATEDERIKARHESARKFALSEKALLYRQKRKQIIVVD
jgi:hypothetical protein